MCALREQSLRRACCQNFLCPKVTASEKDFSVAFLDVSLSIKALVKPLIIMVRAYPGSMLNMIPLLLLYSNIAYRHLMLEEVDSKGKLHLSENNRFA